MCSSDLNTNPDLISAKSMTELTNIVANADIIKKAPTLSESTVNFYKRFIQPNLLPIIIVVIFISFMVYRYMTYSNEKEKFDPNKSINDPTQTKLELSERNPYEFDNTMNKILRDKEANDILNDEDAFLAQAGYNAFSDVTQNPSLADEFKDYDVANKEEGPPQVGISGRRSPVDGIIGDNTIQQFNWLKKKPVTPKVPSKTKSTDETSTKIEKSDLSTLIFSPFAAG